MIYINDIYKYGDIIKRKYHDIFYIFDIFLFFFKISTFIIIII